MKVNLRTDLIRCTFGSIGIKGLKRNSLTMWNWNTRRKGTPQGKPDANEIMKGTQSGPPLWWLSLISLAFIWSISPCCRWLKLLTSAWHTVRRTVMQVLASVRKPEIKREEADPLCALRPPPRLRGNDRVRSAGDPAAETYLQTEICRRISLSWHWRCGGTCWQVAHPPQHMLTHLAEEQQGLSGNQE